LAVSRSFLIAALVAFCAPTHAADATPTPGLPTLALDPQAPAPSIWKGLYVGSDITLSSFKGSHAAFGGVGFAGYDRHFDNNLVLGIRAEVGYAPSIFQSGPYRGYDYAMISGKAGYEMGRLTPYVTAGVALAKPTVSPGVGSLNPLDSANGLFNGSADLAASGIVGAGFDYAISNNTSFGLAAMVGTGRGGLVAPP
jgi:opacity protein-like surface antigen